MSFLLNDIPSNPAIERFVDLSFEVSERIIRLLTEKGLSQRDLANKMGKKDSEISKWLTGNHNFTLRTIAAVETALDTRLVKVDWKPEHFVPIDQEGVVYFQDQERITLPHHSSYNSLKEGSESKHQHVVSSFDFDFALGGNAA